MFPRKWEFRRKFCKLLGPVWKTRKFSLYPKSSRLSKRSMWHKCRHNGFVLSIEYVSSQCLIHIPVTEWRRILWHLLVQKSNGLTICPLQFQLSGMYTDYMPYSFYKKFLFKFTFDLVCLLLLSSSCQLLLCLLSIMSQFHVHQDCVYTLPSDWHHCFLCDVVNRYSRYHGRKGMCTKLPWVTNIY